MFPILLKFGPFTIYSYGVMVALAFSVTSYLMWYNAPKFGFPKEKVIDFFITIIISGIIGARALHVIVFWDLYAKNPMDILMITNGGLAFYGGLIAGFAAGVTFLKINHIPFSIAGDLFSPYAALGQAIGRVGCFLNGCCFGVVTMDTKLGVIFPGDEHLRYPTQIFESVALLLVYFVLRFLLQKKLLKGGLFFIYIMLMSIDRFFIEFIRGDVGKVFLNLTVSQCISIFLFTAGIIGLVWSRRRARV